MKKELYPRWCLAQSLNLVRLEAARLSAIADVDTVHDLRVAIRRTRTLIHEFRPFLTKHILLHKNSLRTMNRLLACARDAHISALWLKKLERHKNLRNRNLNSLIRIFRRRAIQEIQRVQKFLPRFNADEKKISVNLHSSDFPPTLTRAYLKWAKKRLLKREKKLRGLITKVKESDSAKIHRIRIETKKIRYLAETLPIDAKATKRMIEHLKIMQSALGDIHDLTRLEFHVISIRRPTRNDLVAVLQKEQCHLFHRYQRRLEKLPRKLKRAIHKLHQ